MAPQARCLKADLGYIQSTELEVGGLFLFGAAYDAAHAVLFKRQLT